VRDGDINEDNSLGEFIPGGISCWEDAAIYMTERMFESKPVPFAGEDVMFGNRVVDVRAYLDKSIELNFDNGSRGVVARIQDWRLIGGTAILAAERIGVNVEPNLISSTLIRKQTDYGHDNIRRFGSRGLLVRLHDKVARLENLLTKGLDPKNESLTDNMIDVIGYCVIGCMWEAELFLLPLSTATPRSM